MQLTHLIRSLGSTAFPRGPLLPPRPAGPPATLGFRTCLRTFFVLAFTLAMTRQDGEAGPPPSTPGTKIVVQDLLEWERRYRERDVDFLEPRISNVGMEPLYLARDSISQMEDLFGRAAATGSLDAAGCFLRIATYYFAKQPEKEYRGAARIASHRPSWVRERAIDALAAMPPDPVGSWLVDGPLTDQVGSRSEYRRAAAATALGAMGHRPAFYALRLRLDDRSARVRAAAIDALAKLGGTSAVALYTPSLLDREAEVRATAMRCIRRAVHESPMDGVASEALAYRVGEMLADESWWVRRSAALTLARLRSRDSVPRLIEALNAEKRRRVRSPNPRVSAAIRRALVSLTGQAFARDEPEKWTAWWEGVTGEDFQPNAPTRLDPRYQPSFYGITIEASRILFVVDLSGSMGSPGRDPRYGLTGKTKLDQVQREVIRTLGALRSHHEFDLVFFSSDVKRWRGELVRATPESVAAAVKFVEARTARGGTDLWGALEEALDLGEPGRPTPNVGFDADAIVVLSDGWPTLGSIVEPEEIVRLVARSNRHAEVVIHTVSVQGATPLRAAPTLSFMERLAEATGGEFRQVDLE